MKYQFFSAFLWVMASVGSAYADDSQDVKELVQASGCLSCHSVDEKIVGPAFKDVVAKYKSDPDAIVNISQSIKNGSRGKWGRMAMPAHASLSSEELKTLAMWVMTRKAKAD
ncbi:c-type cytochrome [Rhodoferax lithotrophicus]|nr:c-type cytochrome [Rhodoferax sp. MIZ03]